MDGQHEARATDYKSPLHEMTQTTPTCLWNDSASIAELTASIEDGAVGATCNPVIVLEVLKKEMNFWKGRIAAMDQGTAHGDRAPDRLAAGGGDVGRAAQLLKPIFDAHNGRNGRLSIQTDPRFFRDSQAIRRTGRAFQRPGAEHDREDPGDSSRDSGHRGGHLSRREHQCHGLVHPAAVYRRGRSRGARAQGREKEGKEIATMGPVCTIMVGRLDDWLKVVMEKENITIDPGYLEWAGVAVFKKSYRIFRERGYRIRLLSAAFRNHMHWSEFIGGDVVISPPYKWQLRFNASDIESRSRIDEPVRAEIVDELSRKFADFRRAYNENGLTIEEFDSFGRPGARCGSSSRPATISTQVRDILIPNPDATLA